MSAKNQLVYAFPRGEGEQVQIAIREYENRHYLDLRVWFQPEDGSSFKPTRKGICLDLKQMGQLNKGVMELGKAVSRIQQKGLD